MKVSLYYCYRKERGGEERRGKERGARGEGMGGEERGGEERGEVVVVNCLCLLPCTKNSLRHHFFFHKKLKLLTAEKNSCCI